MRDLRRAGKREKVHHCGAHEGEEDKFYRGLRVTEGLQEPRLEPNASKALASNTMAGLERGRIGTRETN